MNKIRKDTGGTPAVRGMTSIVKTVTRGIAGLILLYAIYIILHGHLTPGGGFAGGVMAAAAFLLDVLARGSREATAEAKKGRASLAESVGVSAFWTVAMLGLIAGTFFFYNLLTKGRPFHLLSAGFIPLSNIAIGLEVAGALFLVFFTFSVLKTGGEK
jgi:multisubunit Na+/H+ antiporter MnhB subunit